MEGDVQPFDRDPFFSEYRHMGRNFGNPMINMMAHGLFRNNLIPQPVNGQGMYESMIQRERSAHFLNLQRSGFVNNALFNRLGIGQGGMTGLIGSMAASPGGALAQMMSPALGGNPMAASMGLYASMAGSDTMGNFGRIGGISAKETERVMQEMSKNFYTTQQYEGPGGIKEEQKQKTKDFLKKRFDEGDQGIDYLESEGFRVERDKKGKITKKGREALEKQISSFDLTEEEVQTTKQAPPKVNPVRDAAKDLLSASTDEEKQKAGTDFEKVLKKQGAKPIFINSLKEKGKDTFDTEKVDKFVREQEGDQAASKEEAGDRTKAINRVYAKRLIAGDINQELEKVVNEEDEKQKKALNKNLIETLKKKYEMTEAQLKKAKVIDKDGSVVESKVRELTKKNSQITEIEAQALEVQRTKEVGERYKGINFENTRGFRLEDITSAFTKASELRMVGGRGGNIAASSGEFTKNAGGALDAARSIFGSDRSGSELMAEMSKLVGSSGVDMSTQEGAGKMEDLLRKAKATAHVAGMSMKYLLGIIDSANAVAKSSPQLQYMSAATTTNIGISAVEAAGQLGSMMSGKDYRAAGGSQGIAAQDVQETLNFAQTGMGGFQAAILGATKGMRKKGPNGEDIDVYGQVKKMFEGGMTGTDLQQGGLRKIADLMGKSVLEVSGIGNNTLLQQEALRDEESSGVIATSAKKSAVKSFFAGARNVGLKQEELEAKYKKSSEEGEDYETFARREIIAKLTPQGQAIYKQNKGFIREHMMLSTKTEEEKKEYSAAIAKEQAEDKEMSKELAGKNAPLITQGLDAISRGQSFKDTAEMLMGAFATTDKTKESVKQEMEKAKTAGARIASIAAMEVGDEGKLKAGMGKEINAVVAARRAGLEEKAKDGSDPEAQAKAKKELETLGKKPLTDTQIKNVSDVINTMEDAKTARTRLNDLRAQRSSKKEMKAEDIRSLEGLESAESIGLLEETAFDKAKGNGVSGIGAGVIQAQATYNIKEITDKRKAVARKGLEERLSLDAKEQGEKGGGAYIAKALENYAKYDSNGNVVGHDMQQLIEDMHKPKDARGGKNFFSKEIDEKDAAQVAGRDKLQMELGKYDTAAEQLDAKAAISGQGSSPMQAMSDMSKMLGDIKSLLGSDKGIAGMLDKLAKALM